MQQDLRYRMRRATQTNGWIATRRCVCHACSTRQDDREWPWPKGGHQPLGEIGHVCCVMRHSADIRHMNDQRVIGWAAFGFENLRHRSVVVGICRQTIDRLCG
jgi:hypothetical protein